MNNKCYLLYNNGDGWQLWSINALTSSECQILRAELEYKHSTWQFKIVKEEEYDFLW
jgi:hypothetical protein